MFSFRSLYLQPAALALAGALLLPGPAGAVELYKGDARFARVQRVEGTATIGHAYQVASEFAALQPNDPIGEGDKVNLASGAKLLVNFADDSRLLAEGPAQFELYRLNPRKPYEIRLYSGSVLIDNRADRALYLDTSDGALTVNSRSRALLQGGADGVAVSALAGELVAGDEDHPVRLRGGDGLRLRREKPGAVESAERGAGAGLLRWAEGEADSRDYGERDERSDREDREDRDDEADNEDSDDIRRRHINLPPDVAVYRGELSRHGRWKFISGYGWTWRPYRVSASWIPYSAGFWRHTPRGVFWVSHEPWGWAPYHYGNWRYNPVNGWFWIPGGVFSGAWVVFENDGDWWNWCPSYYRGGHWYPSHTRYIRRHHHHFYHYRTPIVVVNHPHPWTPGQNPVNPPSPPFYPGKPKGGPRDTDPPRQNPASPPFYPGRPKGNPRDTDPREQNPSPPFYPGNPKGNPRDTRPPEQDPSPPFHPGNPKGNPRDTRPPDQDPSPPFHPGNPKGNPRDTDPPEQDPSPPFNPGTKPGRGSPPDHEPTPPTRKGGNGDSDRDPPSRSDGGGSRGHSEPTPPTRQQRDDGGSQRHDPAPPPSRSKKKDDQDP